MTKNTSARRAGLELSYRTSAARFHEYRTPGEADFHPSCGGLWVRSRGTPRLVCAACGAPKPEPEIVLRSADGSLEAVPLSEFIVIARAAR